MIYKTTQKQKSVHATAEHFDEQMNVLLQDFADRGIDVDVTYKIDPSTERAFAALILWEEKEVIPETISDKFKLAGTAVRCGKCPLFKQDDGRKRDGLCEFKCEEVSRKDIACDHFYLRFADIENLTVDLESLTLE